MKTNEMNIAPEKFNLVNENRPLKDKELVTKPIGYFHDAFNRFRKNKGSVVAAIVIGILVLYAIIVPIFSQYTVSYSDPYYVNVLPKTHITQNMDFLDGCSEKTVNEITFIYYYSMKEETGHSAVKNDKYSVKVVETEKRNRPVKVNMYTFRLDSFEFFDILLRLNRLRISYRLFDSYQV